MSVMRRLSCDDSLTATMFSTSARVAKSAGLQIDFIGNPVVVDHDRQIGGGSQCPEVRYRFQTVLLIDHAGQRHQAGATGTLGSFGKRNPEVGGIFSDTRQHRNFSGGDLDRSTQHLLFLVRRQRRVLTQCAQHHQPFDAGFHARLDMPLCGFQIKCAIFGEFRHQRRKDALPVNLPVATHDRLLLCLHIRIKYPREVPG